MKAGVAAGMPVVGMGLRNPEKSLADAGASFVINDFNDPKLWTALEELENEEEITTVTTWKCLHLSNPGEKLVYFETSAIVGRFGVSSVYIHSLRHCRHPNEINPLRHFRHPNEINPL